MMTPAPASTTGAARATILGPQDGERLRTLGSGLRVLADGASTGGQCSMFEVLVAAGEGPPLHRHEREDEFFFVVDGRFKFSVDGNVFVGERGSFGLAPRGTIHAFRNIGATPGVLHVTCTPAGLDEAFRAVRIPEPGSGAAPLTMEQMVAEFAKYGVTIHGPPLGA